MRRQAADPLRRVCAAFSGEILELADRFRLSWVAQTSRILRRLWNISQTGPRTAWLRHPVFSDIRGQLKYVLISYGNDKRQAAVFIDVY
jgi:hypothetical protein